MGLSPKSNYEKKNVSCFDIGEVPRSGIGTGSISCLSVSLSNNVSVECYQEPFPPYVTIMEKRNGHWHLPAGTLAAM